MVKRRYNTTNDRILFIDNLWMGKLPSEWLAAEKVETRGDMEEGRRRMYETALEREKLVNAG